MQSFFALERRKFVPQWLSIGGGKLAETCQSCSRIFILAQWQSNDQAKENGNSLSFGTRKNPEIYKLFKPPFLAKYFLLPSYQSCQTF